MWMKAIVAWFKVLSRNSRGMTEENQCISSEYLVSGPNSSRIRSEYQPDALMNSVFYVMYKREREQSFCVRKERLQSGPFVGVTRRLPPIVSWTCKCSGSHSHDHGDGCLFSGEFADVSEEHIPFACLSSSRWFIASIPVPPKCRWNSTAPHAINSQKLLFRSEMYRRFGGICCQKMEAGGFSFMASHPRRQQAVLTASAMRTCRACSVALLFERLEAQRLILFA
jgi:hypothetical protein